MLMILSPLSSALWVDCKPMRHHACDLIGNSSPVHRKCSSRCSNSKEERGDGVKLTTTKKR
uniref:Uncharacterized protein n=1 Tax=Arundo donax TaxID=35708 RepID=A0A0A9B6U6_ARUDO